MECLRLLFISGLLFTITIAHIYETNNCTFDSSDYFLPVAVAECRHYNIKLITISDSEEYYWMTVDSFIVIHTRTRNIRLHYNLQSLGTNVITQLYSSSEESANNSVHYPLRYIYCSVTQILAIYFSTTLVPGNYILSMMIKGNITSEIEPGFSKMTYFNEDGGQKAVFATNFLWDARRMFPCWDEPALRATFNISVKHPGNYTVLSNMPMREQKEQDNMIWTHFNTTPLMPTYLIAIVMFENLDGVPNREDPMIMWGRSEILRRIKLIYNIASVCQDYISTMNLTNEMPKMDRVVLPSSLLPTRSSRGLYTYKESEILLGSDTILYNEALRLAHHAFGNAVSPAWWNYLWLSDGLARFFGLYISNKAFVQSRLMERFVVENQHLVLSEDILSRVAPVMHKVESPDKITTLFSNVAQQKDGNPYIFAGEIQVIAVFTINHVIYYKFSQFRSVNLNNWWEAIQKALNESNCVLDNWDFETVMINWLMTSNYPVVKVSHIEDLNKGKILRIEQEYFYAQQGVNTYHWWIPINYVTQSHPYFNATLPIFWLKSGINPNVVELKDNFNDDWLIFNVQQSGYYRVNYDSDNWNRLLEYLESDDYTKIHPINRAQLIDDSYHLMVAGQLDSFYFIRISNNLVRDRDYIVWYPMKGILSNMSTFFQFPEGVHTKTRMLEILNDVLKDVGFDEGFYDVNLNELLKLLILELACELGHSNCLEVAKIKLDEFLTNQTIPTYLTPLWENWIICSGMKKSNSTTWLKLVNKYWSTRDFKYLEYLTCAEDPLIIIDYIRKLMLNYIAVEKTEHRARIINNILKKHISDNSVLDYVLSNYHLISSFAQFPIMDIIIKNIYHIDQFKKVKDFVMINSFGEELNHWNFKENLLSNIELQDYNIQAEWMMFMRVFKIK